MTIKVNGSAVVPDWDKMGVMSHSLGAVYITEMLQANSTFAKASKHQVTATSLKSDICDTYACTGCCLPRSSKL